MIFMIYQFKQNNLMLLNGKMNIMNQTMMIFQLMIFQKKQLKNKFQMKILKVEMILNMKKQKMKKLKLLMIFQNKFIQLNEIV